MQTQEAERAGAAGTPGQGAARGDAAGGRFTMREAAWLVLAGLALWLVAIMLSALQLQQMPS